MPRLLLEYDLVDWKTPGDAKGGSHTTTSPPTDDSSGFPGAGTERPISKNYFRLLMEEPPGLTINFGALICTSVEILLSESHENCRRCFYKNLSTTNSEGVLFLTTSCLSA